MIELAGVAMLLGVTVFVVVALALSVVKILVWAMMWPLRLLFGLLLLPLLLLKAIGIFIAGLVMLVVGPILAVVVVAAIVAIAAALVVPLLPLLFVALAVWFLARASTRPAIAR
jgi:hypothetical protein